ncbi:MAG: hypothetical protein J6Z45_04670 [Oscillospiraceae bacterium]|nr:hypothetical protein [Oscillospiraceae bacterium]
MKKRVLSLLLAAGVLFGSGFGSRSAVFAAGQPQKQELSAADGTKKAPQNAPDDTAEPDTTDLTDVSTAEETTTVPVEEAHGTAEIRLRTTTGFPKNNDSIFPGREEKYWDPKTGLLLEDYYTVRLDGTADSDAKGTFRVKAVPAGDGKSYTFAAEKKEAVYNEKTYDISFTDTRTVKLTDYDPVYNSDHKPENYQEVKTINQKGVICLKSDPRFQIAADSNIDSFKGDTVPVSSLTNKAYYLRNVDEKDTDHYHAVSKQYTANVNINPAVSAEAVISPDFDLSKESAYNDDLTVTVTGYAMADTAVMELYSGNTKLLAETLTPVATDQVTELSNTFKLKYTFSLEGLTGWDRFVLIKDLRAVIKAGGSEKSENLKLTDSKRQTADSFILDGAAPSVELDDKPEWNRAIFRIYDYDKDKGDSTLGSGLRRVEYKINDKDWEKASFMFSEGCASYDLWLDREKAIDTNGTVQVEVRVTDCAGNFYQLDGVSMDTDSIDPVIDKIEIFNPVPGTELWEEAAPETVNVLPYGVFTQNPLQFRIRVHDPAPEDGEPSGIGSVTAGGKECTPHTVPVSGGLEAEVADPDIEVNELVGTAAEEIDYYYFDLEPGVYSDFKVTVADNGRNTVSRSLAEILKSAFKIDKVPSNDLYYDADIPSLKAEAQNEYRKTAMNSISDETRYTYWYNRDALTDNSKKIAVSFSDKYGIVSADVYFDGKPVSGYSKDYSSEKSLKKEDSIDIPVSALVTDGSHSVTVSVTDNAGNVTEQRVYLELDFTDPEIPEFSGSGSGELPEDWFRSDGLPVITMLFRDENPEKAVIRINSQEKTFTAASAEWVTDGEGAVTVMLDLADGLDDNGNKFSFGADQVFRLKGTVTDFVGNQTSAPGEHEPEKLIRVDTEAPQVNDVFVNRTESAKDKILRVLTFGIFSNEKFKFSVDVQDGDQHEDQQRESGIASVEIQLEPDGEFYAMTLEEDIGFYTYIVPDNDPDYRLLSDESYQGTVVFRVTDRVGRETTVFAQDPDPDDKEIEIRLGSEESVRTNSNSYMVESILPKITVSMPEPDSEDRTAEKWYSLTDADSKFITVTASDHESGLFEVKATLTVQTKHGFGTVQQSKDYSILDSASVLKLNTETYEQDGTMDREAKFDLLSLFRDMAPDSDGRCEFTVTAVDLAGNSFTTEPIVYYLDWKTPQISSIDLAPESADRYRNTGEYPGGSQFVDLLEYGFYFHEPFTATVNVSDEGPSSGMDRISYRLVEYRNGSLYKTGTEQFASVGADGKASFRIPADFKGQIYVSPYDNVGNTPEKEVTPHSFVVDTPDQHSSEDHISVTGLAATTYRDSEQYPLYTGSVTLTARITDTVSGIRSISYAMNSERNRQEEQTIEIPNTGCRVGQQLRDGWNITKMDENLVTEVERVYSFTGDDNGIVLSFRMTDRANNFSEKKTDAFSIDQTAPVIEAVFSSPAGSGAYYSQKRTAVITVTERNFDASRIRSEITNRIGGVPSVSFRDESDTVHIAELEFDEGDYSFSLSGTDLCDHTAGVNYSGGHENEFYVDLRDPVVTSNFSELTNGARNSFRSDQKVTFSINEHNFVRDSVRITVERAPSGKELNSANRVDCTNEFVTRDMWTDNGDVHTAGFTFSKDAVYRVTISVTDAAGRSSANAVSPIFEVDKKKPILDQPANLSKIVYTKKNPQTEADPIVFADENIDHITYSVVSYRLKRDADQVGYGMDVTESEQLEVKSNSVVLGDEYFSRDGIYEVKCVAYDIAGNLSDSTTHTYVVQRDSDFLVYIPDSSKEEKTGLYKFNQIGIRSADFEDIRVIAYVTSDREFGIQVDGEDVTGEDITVSEITGDALGGGKKAGETINQVTAYDLTLKNSYIAQKYSDETIDTDLLLNAVAASSSDVQKITLGHIYIDNVKPVGEYEAALQDLGFFGGFYGMESRAVKIEGVSPDINLERSEIQLNDTVLTAGEGGFVYDEDAHTIGFTIGKGYTDIKTTLVDNAGNSYVLPIVKKVYVGVLFARFWYLFILGGLALIGVPAFIIISAIRKKRTAAAF